MPMFVGDRRIYKDPRDFQVLPCEVIAGTAVLYSDLKRIEKEVKTLGYFCEKNGLLEFILGMQFALCNTSEIRSAAAVLGKVKQCENTSPVPIGFYKICIADKYDLDDSDKSKLPIPKVKWFLALIESKKYFVEDRDLLLSNSIRSTRRISFHISDPSNIEQYQKTFIENFIFPFITSFDSLKKKGKLFDAFKELNVDFEHKKNFSCLEARISGFLEYGQDELCDAKKLSALLVAYNTKQQINARYDAMRTQLQNDLSKEVLAEQCSPKYSDYFPFFEAMEGKTILWEENNQVVPKPLTLELFNKYLSEILCIDIPSQSQIIQKEAEYVTQDHSASSATGTQDRPIAIDGPSRSASPPLQKTQETLPGAFIPFRVDFKDTNGEEISAREQAFKILNKVNDLYKKGYKQIGITYSANAWQAKHIAECYSQGQWETGIKGVNQANVMAKAENLLNRRKYEHLQPIFRIQSITTVIRTEQNLDPTITEKNVQDIGNFIRDGGVVLGWQNQDTVNDAKRPYAVGGGATKGQTSPNVLPDRDIQWVQDRLQKFAKDFMLSQSTDQLPSSSGMPRVALPQSSTSNSTEEDAVSTLKVSKGEGLPTPAASAAVYTLRLYSKKQKNLQSPESVSKQTVVRLFQNLIALDRNRAEHIGLFDDTLQQHASLFLKHFSMDHFENPNDLNFITSKLLLYYMADLEQRARTKVTYTTRLFGINFGYPTSEKLAAVKDLMLRIRTGLYTEADLTLLAKRHPALRTARLGALYAAVCYLKKSHEQSVVHSEITHDDFANNRRMHL
jgi:hypothetical protein